MKLETLALLLTVALLAPHLALAVANDATGLSASLNGLKQESQADQDTASCKAEQQASAGLPSSLANVIGQGIQKSFAQTVGDVLVRHLDGLIQRQALYHFGQYRRRGDGACACRTACQCFQTH